MPVVAKFTFAINLMKRLEIFLYLLGISLILKGGITPESKTQFRILFELIIYAWSVGIVNFVFCGGALKGFGIRPRTQSGLLGILFSPFLHGDWGHLTANTISFFILGWFVMLGGIQNFFILTIVTPLFSGLGTWLFARPYTNHIGASDIIFGYIGFLLARSYFARDALSIILTVIVGFLYGSNLRDILPDPDCEGISWEGHFFGLMAGLLVASFLDAFHGVFSASIG